MKQDPVSKQRSYPPISLQGALPEPKASASCLQAQGIGLFLTCLEGLEGLEA